MTRLRVNPKIPEGINSSAENPLKEFLWLLAGVVTTLVLAVLLFSVLAQWLAPLIPFRWEQAVTELFEQQLNEESPLNEEPPREPETAKDVASREGATAHINPAVPEMRLDEADLFPAAALALQELGERLLRSQERSAARPSEHIQYHFHLLAETTPNAWATLGGHIFVTTGLLSVTRSENALAMVLSHEMAHVNHRHPIQSLSRGALVQFLLLAVSGGQSASALNSVLGQAGLLTMSSFSRDMEREADAAAVQVLLSHYGHLQGADEFFQQMLSEHGDSRWREWTQTHPNLAARIERLKSQSTIVMTDSGGESQGKGAPALTPLDPRLGAIVTAP